MGGRGSSSAGVKKALLGGVSGAAKAGWSSNGP